jgi:hypothetical protein
VGLWTRKIAPWSTESPESSKRPSLVSGKHKIIIRSDEAWAARQQAQQKRSAQALPATGPRHFGRLTPEAKRIGEMIERETMKRSPQLVTSQIAGRVATRPLEGVWSG